MAGNEENHPQSRGEDAPQKPGGGTLSRSTIEEYRLVPVEEFDGHGDDEKIIDLVGLTRDLWDSRRFLLRYLTVFLVFGAVIYLFGERTYYSETALMPEVRSGSQIDRLLQQYQGILGVQIDSGADAERLNVTLYPDIVESFPFQLELIQQEIYFDRYGRSMTLFEYLNEVREQSVLQKSWDVVWSLTFGLPGTIGNLFRSSQDGTSIGGIDFTRYSDFETPRVIEPPVASAIREMRNRVSVRIEPQTNFVVIGASLPDARASAETVNVIKELLQRYVTDYRIDKARQDLEFVEAQYERSLVQFEEIQDSLAILQDRNVNPARAQSMIHEQRVRARYNLAQDIYTTLATRLEEARIKVQEETPAFRLYEPATIPTRPASPSLKRIVAGAIFLGLFFGISTLYLRRWFHRFMSEFRHRSA